jgi:hypothetical protein
MLLPHNRNVNVLPSTFVPETSPYRNFLTVFFSIFDRGIVTCPAYIRLGYYISEPLWRYHMQYIDRLPLLGTGGTFGCTIPTIA